MKHVVSAVGLILGMGMMQVFAQSLPDISKHSIGHRSGLKSVKKLGTLQGVQPQDEWQTVMKKVAIYLTKPDSVILQKSAQLAVKAAAENGIGLDNPSGRAVTPVIGTGISGTTMNSYTPPDNTMAISNGGRIVAADNEDISYFNETGTSTGVQSHTGFFSNFSTSSYLFDPKLIYDAEEDRFIYVILHGTHYTNSKIFVCFSTSNDPENDGWEVYELPGNPLDDFSWTDYPSIGLNANELFISTNLFFSGGGFNEAVIYQVDKFDGYNGSSSLDYQLWDGIFDANGGRAFTVVPATYGQQGTYGPEMYFVSSRSGGSSRFYYYEITDEINGSPQLTVDDIIVNYSVSGDANQSGSSSLVDVGDCRVQSAFFLNGIIHTVHAANYQNSGYSGINYYRIPVDQPTFYETTTFGQTGFDYAYPSIASFGLNECDKSVMVGALRTGPSIFPEMRVMNCDNDMQWSASTQIIGGNSPISFIGSPERWGDYSSMQRKHNANSPEVWMSGCHTVSNRYRTRIAEIKGDYDPAEGPGIDFYSNDSVGEPIFTINFYDNSSGNPIAWEWNFEGGTPSSSTQQNPLVSYLDTGMYDVQLIAWNDDCVDSLTIADMIIIQEITPDTDTIVLGGGFTVYVIDGDTFQTWDGGLVPLGVEDLGKIDNRVYPNPISPMEMMYVDIEIDEAVFINAIVYDMSGRKVKNLFSDYVKPGKHQLGFNKHALPSGQYILHVKSESNILINEKIIVQR